MTNNIEELLEECEQLENMPHVQERLTLAYSYILAALQECRYPIREVLELSPREITKNAAIHGRLDMAATIIASLISRKQEDI